MVHVRAQSFERTMNNEATELSRVTASAEAREYKYPYAPGEVPVKVLSDAGSTPAISTINLKPRLHGGALSLYMDIKGVERER